MLAIIKQVDHYHGGLQEIVITLAFVRISEEEKEQVMNLYDRGELVEVDLSPVSSVTTP